MMQFRNKGLIKSCQLIFATHSPFIVQNLSAYNCSFTLVQKDRNQIQAVPFSDIPHLTLPNRSSFSFNLIMYKIFDMPTTELHNELFGELQEKTQCYYIGTYVDKKESYGYWWLVCIKWIKSNPYLGRGEKRCILQKWTSNITHPYQKCNSSPGKPFQYI